jgi:hypothetical protein
MAKQINVVHDIEALLRRMGILDFRAFDFDTVLLHSVAGRLAVGIDASYFETLAFRCRKKMPSAASHLQEAPAFVKLLYPLQPELRGNPVIAIGVLF